MHRTAVVIVPRPHQTGPLFPFGRQTSASKTILRMAVLLLIVLSLAVWLSLKTGSGRLLLWHTIEACELDQRFLHLAMPCLEVTMGRGKSRDYAILRSPLDLSHIILAPTERIVGIEAPSLRREDAPNYLAEAWAVRRLAFPAGRPPLSADAIGLAINSQRGRTQDQLHIHIDCLRMDVKARLAASLLPPLGQWASVQVDNGDLYAVMSLAGRLEASNVIDLSARHLQLSSKNIQSLTLAVVALRTDPNDPGFLLLARKDRSGQHAELLLDHDCSAYRR